MNNWKSEAALGRRTLLGVGLATVMHGKTRPWREIEGMLRTGVVPGKLHKDELPTPALCVDLDGLEANIAKMAAHAKAAGKALRPHGKTHKCSTIARLTIKAGAVGACAAKIGEAEVFAAKGIRGLLLTSSLVGAHRIERALALAKLAPDTIFCVDNAAVAQQMDDAAGAARRKLRVALDLNVGRRSGCSPEMAVGLAEQVSASRNLVLQGIQAYAGHASHVIGFAARKAASQEAMGLAVAARERIQAKGIACNWLSGGSTGTYNIDSENPGITELQPGSYMFMDVDYNRIGGQEGAVYEDFRNALTVVSTVYSKPSDTKVILDAGLKSFATDRKFGPEVVGVNNRELRNVPYAFSGDEHGALDLTGLSTAINLGDRVELVIPHCDPTVNLYDRIFATRGGYVEAVWQVDARGRNT